MNKVMAMIVSGETSIEEVAQLEELSKQAKFAQQAAKACKKTMLLPIGENKIKCYNYIDGAGEYEAWGECTHDGVFTCWCNWGGNHQIGHCNLLDSIEILMALQQDKFKSDLKRFLEEQITKAESMPE